MVNPTLLQDKSADAGMQASMYLLRSELAWCTDSIIATNAELATTIGGF